MDLCINNIKTIIPENENFRKQLLRKCEERKENPQTDNFYVYQCSFSTKEDSLSLWNYYTKGDSIKGYNLCFNSKDLYDKLQLTSDRDDGKVPAIWKGKVVYKKKCQLKIVNDICNKFYRYSEERNHDDCEFTIDLLINKLMIVGVFFKKSCFKIEKEYRFVLALHVDPSSGQYSVIKEEQKFYEKNGILIPYVDIKFEPNALIQVGISPTLDLSTTKNSIYRATVKKFPQIKKKDAIKKSKIPVRY